MFAFRTNKLLMRRIVMLCAILYLLFSYTHKALYSPLFGVSDFGVFYTASHIVTSNGARQPSDIYVPKQFRPLLREFRPTSGGTKFLYPPQAAVVFSPLHLLSFRQATAVWLIANVIICIGAYYIIIDRLVRDDVTRLRYSFFLILLTQHGVVYEVLRTGQINGIILALLVGTLILIQKKSAWSGMPLAVATSLKIFPLLFTILYVAKKQWRALCVWLATLFALWIATVPFFGWGGLLRFYEYPFKATMAGTINNVSTSPSLYGTFVKIINKMHLQVHDVAVILGVACSILLALSVIAVGYAYMKEKISILIAYSIIMCAILLFSKFVQSQYMLYLLPPALLLLSKLKIRSPLRAIAIIITLYCLFFWNFFPTLNSLLLHRITLIGVICMTTYCVWNIFQKEASTPEQK